jgi:hypothetical protein
MAPGQSLGSLFPGNTPIGTPEHAAAASAGIDDAAIAGMNYEPTRCDPLILEGFRFKPPINAVAGADDDNSV